MANDRGCAPADTVLDDEFHGIGDVGHLEIADDIGDLCEPVDHVGTCGKYQGPVDLHSIDVFRNVTDNLHRPIGIGLIQCEHHAGSSLHGDRYPNKS